MVVKKNGRRAPFDRDKLQHSVEVALRKRAVAPERVERMINGIVRQLESQGDADIPTERIGELVMEGLKGLDDVAYVRFASVYRNFREARDFNAIVGELEAEPEAEPPAGARERARAAATERRMSAEPATTTSAGWPPRFASAGAAWAAAPNPSVGALIVQDGVVVGRGVTAPGGRPHAERRALDEAGEAARGATLYVTLEPCSHFGATPPCAEAIVAAGISRVVCALEDPDERVAGSGLAILRAAGIELTSGARRRDGPPRSSRPYPARRRGAADGDAQARAHRRRLRGGRRARRAPGDHRRSRQSSRAGHALAARRDHGRRSARRATTIRC